MAVLEGRLRTEQCVRLEFYPGIPVTLTPAWPTVGSPTTFAE